jgi:hypothetical protein
MILTSEVVEILDPFFDLFGEVILWEFIGGTRGIFVDP